MTRKLAADYRTSNQVGFVMRSNGQVLNTVTLALEDFDSGNYADYIILGTRVGSTPTVEADIPAGAPAALYDCRAWEAVGTDGAGAGGFAETLDLPAGGVFTIQWNGEAIVDDLGNDVDPLVALITLAEAKQYLDISGTESDAIVAALINACSEWVIGEIGRELVAKTVTEYYNGDGSRTLMLNRRPVVSVTSIHVDANRLWGADCFIDSANYTIDKATGMLRAWNLFGNWPCWHSNIRVIYVAGYTAGPSGTMPKDIKLAVCRILDHQWRDGFSERKLDVISDVIGAANRSYRDGDIPKDARAMLDRYRNYNAGSPQFDYAD